MIAANGQVIAKSQAYATKTAALNGVSTLRRNATTAAVNDLTPPVPSAKRVTVSKTAARKATS